MKDIENISDNFDLSNLTPRPATGKFLLILSLVFFDMRATLHSKRLLPVCTLVICRCILEGGLFFVVGEQ